MEHISNYIHISYSFGMNKHIAGISHTCAHTPRTLAAAIVQIKSSAAGSKRCVWSWEFYRCL